MMPDTRKLRGTVLDAHTKSRYEGATVRLQREGGEPAFYNADDDGDFEFDLTDEARWPPGAYKLTVFHPASRHGEKVTEIKLEADKKPEFQLVEMISDQERSDPAGWGFLGVLLLLLAALVVGYFSLHTSFPNPTLPLDEPLTALVTLARTQAGETTTLDASSPISSTISAAETVFTALREEPDQTLISTQKGQMVAALLSQAKTAILAGDKSGLQTVLASLDEAILQPTTYFWQSDPWRLLEILMWALATTMVRLAINTGNYLQKREFHWRAIPTRLVVLVTVPIMAVLIAFVLSLVSVSITISDVALKLDMRNVTISIVVAGLIGLAPWKSWGFLRRLADTFFSQLAGLIGGPEEKPTAAQPPPTPTPPTPPEPAPAPEPEPAPAPPPEPESPQPSSAPRSRLPSEDWGLDVEQR